MQILAGVGRSHPLQKCTHVIESLSLSQTQTWNILATILHQYVRCKSKLFIHNTSDTKSVGLFHTQVNSILTRTTGLAKTLQVEGSVP